jgi:cyclase
MQRERVTDDIYVFTSDLYAQVTAGVILTEKGAVLFDTLPYPEETKQIKRFVEERLHSPVRYVINSHFHADHTNGTCFFSEAHVIAHERCRELLNHRGRESLEQLKTNSSEMQDVQLVLPNIAFNDLFTLHLGNKTLKLRWTPGHSFDSIICFVEEDQVLFAADTVMPVPYFVDGSYTYFVSSLKELRHYPIETIIQGHGEVILKGEVEEKLQEDLDYLVKLREVVGQALIKPSPEQALSAISIEDCGKSRILLNGAVQQLHRQNVMALAAEHQSLNFDQTAR